MHKTPANVGFEKAGICNFMHVDKEVIFMTNKQ